MQRLTRTMSEVIREYLLADEIVKLLKGRTCRSWPQTFLFTY